MCVISTHPLFMKALLLGATRLFTPVCVYDSTHMKEISPHGKAAPLMETTEPGFYLLSLGSDLLGLDSGRNSQ